MKTNPYLNFDGNAREAFEFYKKVFGGEFGSIMTFGDMPSGEGPQPTEQEKSLIMHISLPIGDFHLMGSDIAPSMGQKLTVGNNIYINLVPDSKEEGQKLFDALSEDGKVEMPFAKQFWGDYFGSFFDKFGVAWMVNCGDK